VTVGAGERRESVDVGPPAWLHHHSGWSRRLDPRPGGPGSVVIDGLEPATTYRVWVEGPGMARTDVGPVRTLDPPPGELLSRFTTISDTHIGETRFGFLGDIVEARPPDPAIEPYPERCARAALDEARRWGSELMVVKGDLTDRTRPREFDGIHALLTGSGLECVAQLGNHDVLRWIDAETELPGIDTADAGRIVVRDLPGARIVLGHSPIFRDHPGDLDAATVDRLGEAVADAAGPAVVCLHHPPQRWPVPRIYPPGLLRTASRALTSALQRANPATVVLAGHTHRTRRYTVDGTTVAEVGSTKDYPGVWAGYAVHEGGLRQVVRRISRPDVIRWTEATACGLGGQWGRWSPGRLDDRCWSFTWPAR
jgi:Icc protein